MAALPSVCINRLTRVFQDIDADNSGSICSDELLKAFHSTLSLTVTKEDVNNFIHTSDVSGDGLLDFDEFCAFYRQQLMAVFCILDKDESGNINVHELKDAFNQLGYKVTKREVNALLSQVDANKDGVVDFDEFCCYFSSLPSPNLKLIVEQWASGLSVDVGTDLAPPALPPPSISIWLALFAGGVAGIVSRTFTAPLEKIKLIAQTSTTDKRVKIIPSIRNIITKEKWIGLFRGNGANCLRVLPFSALVCVAYSNMTKYFPLDNNTTLSSGLGRMMAGTFAGIFATILTHPIDVIRAKITIQTTNKARITNTFMTILQTQGYKGLFRGLVPTLAAIGPFIGIQQSTYDLMKHWFSNNGYNSSPTLFLACGSISGLTAQTVVYPFDVVRRQMQVHTDNRNPMIVAKNLILRRKLFAGLSVTYIKVMPSVAISLFVRDALLGRL